jgi:hypothetical protein
MPINERQFQRKKDFASLLDWKNNLLGNGHLNLNIGIQIWIKSNLILF